MACRRCQQPHSCRRATRCCPITAARRKGGREHAQCVIHDGATCGRVIDDSAVVAQATCDQRLHVEHTRCCSRLLHQLQPGWRSAPLPAESLCGCVPLPSTRSPFRPPHRLCCYSTPSLLSLVTTHIATPPSHTPALHGPTPPCSTVRASFLPLRAVPAPPPAAMYPRGPHPIPMPYPPPPGYYPHPSYHPSPYPPPSILHGPPGLIDSSQLPRLAPPPVPPPASHYLTPPPAVHGLNSLAAAAGEPAGAAAGGGEESPSPRAFSRSRSRSPGRAPASHHQISQKRKEQHRIEYTKHMKNFWSKQKELIESTLAHTQHTHTHHSASLACSTHSPLTCLLPLLPAPGRLCRDGLQASEARPAASAYQEDHEV